jgi:hypothetical protein
MSAHYSGMCRNLGLWANLQALQLATVARRIQTPEHVANLREVSLRADDELKKRGEWDSSEKADGHFTVEIDLWKLHVQVGSAALSIIRTIRSGHSAEELAGAVDEQTLKLVEWYSRMTDQYKEMTDIAVDRSGFIVMTKELRIPHVR